jgi:hypothetical protein
MEQKGMTPKDLVPMIGRINRVYEVLSRRRPLALAMIQRLHSGLGIPAESLIRQPDRRRAAGSPGICHTQRMKRVGKRRIATPAVVPGAAALQAAAVHQACGQALAAVATTGIPEGIYRFASHEEMNRHTDEAMARAIASNARRRAAAPR